VHELNQPLTAILSNAQAAHRLLSADKVDLQELREIIADIAGDDKRAAGIVRQIADVLMETGAEAARDDSHDTGPDGPSTGKEGV
jgi:two-component system sensor kinase FixL